MNYGSDLLILSAYAPLMPPLFLLLLSMMCDDSDGHGGSNSLLPGFHENRALYFMRDCERLCIISALDIRHVLYPLSMAMMNLKGYDEEMC
nr:hypothetical protein [Tanacetum cinerariifolium]